MKDPFPPMPRQPIISHFCYVSKEKRHLLKDVCAFENHLVSFSHTRGSPYYISFPSLRAKICLVSVFFYPQSSSCLWFIDSFFACASHLAFLAPYIPAKARHMSAEGVSLEVGEARRITTRGILLGILEDLTLTKLAGVA